MKRPPLALLLADGWKSVEPRSIDKKLVWVAEQRLYVSDSDFVNPVMLGEVGPADCPIGVDAERRQVFRYACPQDRSSNDYSEIRAFDLDTGKAKRIFGLGLNKWAIWLFHHLKARRLLIGLVATSMPGPGVNIQHQLGLFDIEQSKSLLVQLPRDAFFPLDICPNRQEILFYGVEGYQRVNFKGKRIALLRSSELPNGKGGAYHPTESLVALGGSEILLWNYQDNHFERINDRGQCPVWDVNRDGVWFSQSSADLYYYDRTLGTKECIMTVAGNPLTEVKFARPVQLTSDGRYLSTLLTRKIKRKLTAGDTSKSPFYFVHALCVLDLVEKEVWQYGTEALNWAWVE